MYPQVGEQITSVLNRAASSTGCRNTYYNLRMWSVTNDEEIHTGWVYSGSYRAFSSRST